MKKDFTQVSNKLIHDASISDQHFRTLVVLMSFKYGEKGRIFPSQNTIAKIRGKDRRTIVSHIKILKSKGMLTSKKRGYSSTNEYFINSAKYDTIGYGGSVESSTSKASDLSTQLSQNSHIKNTKENNAKIKKNIDKIIKETREKLTFLGNSK